jgi:oligosaccharide repeat unit polymerase
MLLSSRSPLVQIALCVLIAAILLVPALLFQQFALAIVGIIVLGLASLLFTRPLYALLGYVMLIPFEELAVFDALGTPTRLAGILFFAAYLFHRRFQINVRVMPLAAWLWLAWVTASLMWSHRLAWDFYFQGVQLFLATLLIADYLSRNPKNLKYILNGYMISALLIAFMGIYNFFGQSGNVSGFSAASRTSGIQNQGVETFAFSLVPGFLVAFHYLITTKRSWVRLLNIALLVMFALGMILSGTRGSWVATVGALVLVYLPRLKPRHYLTIVISVVLGTGIALQVPVIADFVNYRVGSAVSSGGEGRITIWLVSWNMFMQHPVTGIGWRMSETFMSLQDFDSTRQNLTWEPNFGRFQPRTPHNIYLQNLVELGTIGFVLFMFWLIPLVTGPVHRDPELRDLWLVALAICTAMLVGGLTNPAFAKKYFWLALALPQGLRYYWLNHKSFTATSTSSAITLVKRGALSVKE